MTSKLCSKCAQNLPLAAFNRDRRTTDGLMSRCKACRTSANKTWRSHNPDYEKARYRKDPAGHRERHLVRKYGVSLATYDRMLAEQEGRCAICRRTQTRAFDVDHCHNSKAVRGLLCTNCNRMIGHAADDPARLRKGADYLESSRKSRSKSSKRSPK